MTQTNQFIIYIYIYIEIITVHCENYTEHTHTLCVRNAGFYLKEGGTYNNCQWKETVCLKPLEPNNEDVSSGLKLETAYDSHCVFLCAMWFLQWQQLFPYIALIDLSFYWKHVFLC